MFLRYWTRAGANRVSSGWNATLAAVHAVEDDLVSVERHPRLQVCALIDAAEELVALTADRRDPIEEQLNKSQKGDEIARAHNGGDPAYVGLFPQVQVFLGYAKVPVRI